jgi:hypothetical protein
MENTAKITPFVSMLAGEKKKDWKINPFSHSVHPTTSYSSTPGISAPSP